MVFCSSSAYAKLSWLFSYSCSPLNVDTTMVPSHITLWMKSPKHVELTGVICLLHCQIVRQLYWKTPLQKKTKCATVQILMDWHCTCGPHRHKVFLLLEIPDRWLTGFTPSDISVLQSCVEQTENAEQTHRWVCSLQTHHKKQSRRTDHWNVASQHAKRNPKLAAMTPADGEDLFSYSHAFFLKNMY